MIKNHPLGHLKISSGNTEVVLNFIAKRISENRRAYCIPLNLTKYVMSKRDTKLQEAINLADIVIADGIPILWLSKRMGYDDVFRVTGIDIAESIISNSKKHGWKIYFFGASEKNMRKAIEKINERFNNPYVIGFRNGYFKQCDIDGIIDDINVSQADILLLGLGLPQKEYFIRDYFERINVKFCLAVGGAFDVWSEEKKRTPKIIQRMGLEWFFRSFYDRNKFLNITKYGFIFLKDLLFYKK